MTFRDSRCVDIFNLFINAVLVQFMSLSDHIVRSKVINACSLRETHARKNPRIDVEFVPAG